MSGYIKGLNEDVVQQMRQLFKENRAVVPVLEYLIKALELDNKSSQKVVVYFVSTFHIGIPKAKIVAAWHYFADGTCSDEELESNVAPSIIKEQDRWMSDG